jgi:hypothetical protein
MRYELIETWRTIHHPSGWIEQYPVLRKGPRILSWRERIIAWLATSRVFRRDACRG